MKPALPNSPNLEVVRENIKVIKDVIENEPHLIPEIEIGNCGGNGGRGISKFGRGGGSLAICLMESKDGLRGGGLVVIGGRSSSVVSKRSWGEVGGVENKSSMGSMLISKGGECMDGWVGVGGGEVKGV
ncbi:hypothetical protein Tco_0295025 [Tanacetum coccineum]